MKKTYLFRIGNGNDGNFPRVLVNIASDEDAYTAIKALVANEYIIGSKTRKHILDNIEVHGDDDFTIYADVLEGPNGETHFGNAWLTASLERIENQEDIDFYINRGYGTKDAPTELRDYIDHEALKMFEE